MSTTFRILGLRRYPVKSMGGESLEVAQLDERGVSGDRWYAVSDDDGRLASGKNTRRFRRRDAVFGYRARTDQAGAVFVGRADREWHVASPELERELTGAMRAPVRVMPEQAVPHQDAGAVSLVGSATLDWYRRERSVNADPRRLRVNIVLETSEAFIEEGWTGRELVFGRARLGVVERVPRCRMIDVDQDSAAAEGRWLKLLAAERDLCLAMYADVAEAGHIRVGDIAFLR